MWSRIKQAMHNFYQPTAAILMYHQICARESDPWELAVHPDNFEAQVQYLKRKFNVVPLEELTSSLTSKKLRKKMLSITFDDGFRDNYVNARPVLEAYNLPATFYLSTQALQSNKLYWWDELQTILLHTPRLPEYFALEVDHTMIRFRFRNDHVLNDKLRSQIAAWKALLPPSNERLILYMQLWQYMKPLPHPQQLHVLEKIKAWAGVSQIDHTPMATMGLDEVRTLGQNPLFSIGAHTVHHVMLTAHGKTHQGFEIRESKKEIEALLEKPVRGFAYPYGNYNALTKSLLREAGYQYAVSTHCRLVTANTDVFELPRVQVKSWSAKELAIQLQMLN